MKKTHIVLALSAAVALTSTAHAASKEMEKCRVVKDGVGLIKAHKSDCKTSKHSCSGMNKAGDAEAWILVKKGDCAKINAGHLEGIAPKTLERIETSKLQNH